MAQFRGVLSGQRGQASRLGSKGSGLTVHCDGWNGGVTVHAFHENGKDRFRVVRSGGSNGRTPEELISEFEVEG